MAASMNWVEVYRDSDQVIERRQTGEDEWEERRTPLRTTPETRLAAVEDAVDTLILDSLGGLDV